jgi:hypothetical protein
VAWSKARVTWDGLDGFNGEKVPGQVRKSLEHHLLFLIKYKSILINKTQSTFHVVLFEILYSGFMVKIKRATFEWKEIDVKSGENNSV